MVYTKPVDSVFARSDWLLKLGIFLDFSREIPLNSQKKNFGAGYPLVWYVPLFASTSVNSCKLF